MALDVNALKERAGKLTKSFNPAQLVVIGLLTVVALIGAMAFMKWASAPSYSVLFTDLDAKAASSVVEKLKADGVPYQLSNEGTAVMVPTAKVYDLRLSLSSAGLPEGGTVGYELLDKHGLTTSEFTQKVDYQRAVEGELARTLMALDGVDNASVHLAVPENRLFTDDKEATRASVLLKTSTALGDDAVQSIVNLVASSVPNLAPADVTVADTSGRVLSSSGTTSGAASTRQIELADQYQRQLSSDASAMLTQVFGPGHAVVRVSAQLNFDETERSTETYSQTEPKVLKEQTASEKFTGSGTPPGGTLGVTGAPASTTGTGNNYEKNDASKEYGVDRVVETAKVAPGKVQRLSAAVVLDGSAQPVPEAAKVEKLVAAALGLDTARGDTIVVDTIGFDQSVATAAKEAKAKAAGQASTTTMMSYVRTGVGSLALLLVLFFLARGLKQKKTEPVALPEIGPGSVAAAIAAAQTAAGNTLGHSELPASIPALVGAGAAGLAQGLPAGLAASPTVPGQVPLPAVGHGEDDLLRLIDQQPEEMAVLLRSWLADRRS
jgi:flagellar M-ring protein FliF